MRDWSIVIVVARGSGKLVYHNVHNMQQEVCRCDLFLLDIVLFIVDNNTINHWCMDYGLSFVES